MTYRPTTAELGALFPQLPIHAAPRARKQKKITAESRIVSACMKWLHAQGVFCWRQNTGAYRSEATGNYIRYGFPGCPDIIGLTKTGGRFLGVEAKASSGLTESQRRFAECVRRHGGLYLVAHSIDELEARKKEILA